MKPSKTIATIELSPNALYILKKRYLKKDARGRIMESPADMFHRVARVVARAERIYNPKADIRCWEQEFYSLMATLQFLPNSPTLLNAGRLSGQLSSCFFLPVEDSLESIFTTLKKAVLVHQSGGGTGFTFSRIRPQHAQVGQGGEFACGPAAFIVPFSSATAAIKQGGIRRGCSIAILDVHHPDILDFIRAKDDPHVLPNFYLSVGVTTQFMQAVKAGKDYDLTNPRTGEVVGHLNAREVFKRIVAQTWKTGDPGLIFLDRMQQNNPVPHLGEVEGVSGCGEQLLLPYESCNLGSINLARMLKKSDKVEIDWEKLSQTTRLALRFLDNVVDVNKFPLPQIAEMTRKTRKIGLGVMGFADMLIQLNISYASEEALKLAEEVMSFINNTAHKTSAELAEERGVFPTYKGSIYDRPGGPKMRNASCSTIAPTGTISLIAGCSNGIEPLFALVFMRHILEGNSLLEINSYFIRLAKSLGFYSEELIQKLAQGARLADMEGIPTAVRRLFVSAIEISPDWHVRMQAAFQRHTDNAVSKTVNLPHEATREDIAHVYMLAYEQGLKGITIYRDGSRRQQPLATKINTRLITRQLKQL